MKEQEIIERWKQNDRYFASPNITDEMREWAREHISDMQCYTGTSGWCQKAGNIFFKDSTYRLHPDFELPKEPEFEYLEITTYLRNGIKVWIILDNIWATLAPSIVGFVGYTSTKNECEPSFPYFHPDHKYVKIRKD